MKLTVYLEGRADNPVTFTGDDRVACVENLAEWMTPDNSDRLWLGGGDPQDPVLVLRRQIVPGLPAWSLHYDNQRIEGGPYEVVKRSALRALEHAPDLYGAWSEVDGPTEGPWLVDESYVRGLRNGRDGLIAEVFYDEENEPTLEELEANRRLIAHAWQMQQWMRQMVPFLQGWFEQGRPPRPALVMARCREAEAMLRQIDGQTR